MKLILNADDLGYSPAVNEAILNLHEQGRLSSTSLVVNLRYSRDALEVVKEQPGLGVGVHLNLTKGRPCLPGEQIASLVSDDGNFHHTPVFYTRALAGGISLLEVEAEVRAQIERVLAAGIHPTHLDSHSHWQILPPLAALIPKLAREYGIPGVRQAGLRQTLMPTRLWLALVKEEVPPSGSLNEPNYLLSLHQWLREPDNPHPLFQSHRMQALLGRPDVIAELVVHPGSANDPDFPPDTLVSNRREWETAFLLSNTFETWLQDLDAEIVSYDYDKEKTDKKENLP
jgi:predicted glycoside hydrolase/deacetylase ChbG (UPF0249 family)